MKKCKLWLANDDKIWRKEIKEEYYTERNKKIKEFYEDFGLEQLPDITPKEELELEKSNPLWFCEPNFYPDKIIDGVPYYVPLFYSVDFEGCFSLMKIISLRSFRKMVSFI